MNDILFILLTIAGIAALGYLAMVLKSIHSILSNINDTMEDKAPEIDRIISDAPILVESVQDLTENVNTLVADVDVLLANSEDDLGGIVRSVNGVMTDVSNITSMADGVVTDLYLGAENLKDTVNSFSTGVSGFRSVGTPKLFRKKPSGFMDYFMIARDFVRDVNNILNN